MKVLWLGGGDEGPAENHVGGQVFKKGETVDVTDEYTLTMVRSDKTFLIQGGPLPGSGGVNSYIPPGGGGPPPMSAEDTEKRRLEQQKIAKGQTGASGHPDYGLPPSQQGAQGPAPKHNEPRPEAPPMTRRPK